MELLQRQNKVHFSSKMQNISNLPVCLPSYHSLGGVCRVVERIGNEPRESCNVIRVLSSSLLFFQACNLMAILIIYFDQPTAHGASELWSKLKISATLFLGFTGSAMIWWYTCSSREFLFQMLLKVTFVVSVAFVILLFAWDARNNIDVQLEVDTQQASMKICSLLWKVFKENRRTVLFITLSLVCLLVILSWSPRSAENEALLDALYSVRHHEVCCWNRSTSNVL